MWAVNLIWKIVEVEKGHRTGNLDIDRWIYSSLCSSYLISLTIAGYFLLSSQDHRPQEFKTCTHKMYHNNLLTSQYLAEFYQSDHPNPHSMGNMRSIERVRIRGLGVVIQMI